MNPVTGPFSDTFSAGIGTGSRWWSRQIYRQAKPYDLPLPYTRDDRGVGSEAWWGTKTGPTLIASSYGTLSPKRYQDLSSWFVASVTNQARDRLMNKLNSDTLLLAALAEAKGSINIITTSLDSARYVLNALRPGNWWRLRHSSLARVDAAGKPHISVRGVGKKFADDILSVYFGIMPVMSDVQSAAETLSKDFSPLIAEGSGKRADSSFTKLLDDGTTRLTKREEWWFKSKCGCEAKVTNPNLYLAQSMGLINPFATAWELVPWSFVVDYFVNVNSFVNSLTDLYGLSLTKAWTRNTMWSFAEGDDRTYNPVSHAVLGGRHSGVWYRATRATQSIPSVSLSYRQFSLGKDLSRCVTSAALLLQALSR